MNSIMDIVGPIMIGPSSSHTAGAAKMAKMARILLGAAPVKADIHLYGSFALTYLGHGTDKALIAGLLGMSEDDERLPSSLTIAEKRGFAYRFIEEDEPVEHPNTVKFVLADQNGNTISVVGRSLGGGRIAITNINGKDMYMEGMMSESRAQQFMHDHRHQLAV